MLAGSFWFGENYWERKRMIDFEHVSKQYKHNAKPALEDVNFHVDDGEFVFLLGHSGAGKSTLLKTIAGVYKPTKGKVTVNGTIAPLIELGAGFDMDLTARENIYLNCSVRGFSPKDLDAKF
ncbi:ABC transporter ATP-binding protein, partial [Soehngenia saccharolytica]